MSKALKVFSVAAVMLAAPAWAHHGFGRFDPTKDVTIEGTLTGIDFVNPHAWLYFDAMTADGKVQPMRCEMRAATVLRRSGWSEEMFVPGKHVVVSGNPHRDDPAFVLHRDAEARRRDVRALSAAHHGDARRAATGRRGSRAASRTSTATGRRSNT